jgi:hypothetical protein
VTRSGKVRERRQPERKPSKRMKGDHRDFTWDRAVARPNPPENRIPFYGKNVRVNRL